MDNVDKLSLRQLFTAPLCLPRLAVSVVIPMYNKEKYVGECLDSLLIQTLQNFEVIVVDDCSTDNSVAIVESYREKFGGRLKLVQTETNSGGGGYVPRNIGLNLACGEYVIFLDSDDFILGTALETLYNAAKEYDADVTYTGARYFLTAPNKIKASRDGEGRTLIKQGLEDKPNLTINDPDKNIWRLFFGDNYQSGWTKFVRRDLLIKEKITFPTIITGGDYIWSIHVYCCSKRFLRLPIPLYFYRIYDDNSVTKVRKSPPEQISRFISAFIAFTKSLRQLESKYETLSKNPANCFTAFKNYFEWHFSHTRENTAQLSDQEIYEILCNEFSKQEDLSDSIKPFCMSFIFAERKSHEDKLEELRDVLNSITARIDIEQLYESGNFQILSVSDEKAKIMKPKWLQKVGTGYQINSHAGEIEIIAKASVDGQIRLSLKGLDIRDPVDNLKRIPYWINYTKLTINGNTIFDKLTSAWHDKPYRYIMNATGGEEITVKAEWIPRMSKTEPYIGSYDDKFYHPSYPAISVVIPLYNAKEYIIECLDSLLAQTFKNFELILVDDCSTDSSCDIVESYMTKFDGRLKLYHTEKNHGTGAAARSKGLRLSCGEYIYSMDNDDLLTKTALEELYSLAKEYDADVVYCEKYYMSTGVGKEFVKNIHPAVKKIQKPPYVTKPTFIPDDPVKRFKEIIDGRFWPAPWCKLVRREVIIKNELFFPTLKISDDDIWTFGLVFCAKRFLRVPNAVYIRRMRETSITGVKKKPQQTLSFWLNPILLGLKNFDDVIHKSVFFQKNTKYLYAALRDFINRRFDIFIQAENRLPQHVFYETVKKEFGDKLGEYDVLIAALCTIFYTEKRSRSDDAQTVRMLSKAHVEDEQTIRKLSKTIDENNQIFRKFAPYFTARVDIKLTNKVGIADMQILSVSDENAVISKPSWFQKNGIGYAISSYAGNLKIVVRAGADGKILLALRGKDVRNPDDKSKRVPCWIDYTALTINGQAILDTLTPTWHNKPYKYNMNVKADEEITLQIEWIPHIIYAKTDKVITPAPPLPPSKDNLPEQKMVASDKKIHAEVEKLLKKTTALEKNNAKLEQTIRKLTLDLTARIDIKLTSNTEECDFQIISLSDDKAKVTKAAWLNKGSIGYAITSHTGNLKIAAKSSVDGQIQLYVRGSDVRNPENKSKRIPYWIDCTKLTVNEQTILDTLTPVWHNKPYRHTMEVKADEEITLQVEWLPHRSDT